MDIERQLDGVVRQAIAERRVVGAVVIVRQHGRTLYEKAHGLADRAHGTPMALDTIFRLSSLTKPIIAATILALSDAGHLRLDDPVTTYIPDFRPLLPDGSQPAMTIKHLLTHTAGLPGDVPLTEREKADPRLIAAGGDRFHLPLRDNVLRLNQFPLLFAPGTRWAYSQATDVLGLVAATAEAPEGVLGDVVERWVTGPLRMVDTSFELTDRSRLAAAYADGIPEPVPMSDPHQVPNPFGGMTTYYPNRIFDARAYHSGVGGMAGTGPDFMKLLEAMNSDGAPILRPKTNWQALADQTPALPQSQSPGWKFSYFGAWLDEPGLANSPANRGTNRWGGIYGHTWFVDPAIGLSVVSMTNTGLEGCDGAYKDLVRNAVYAGLA